MKAFEHDVAVSAVRYDAHLVAELIGRLQPSLAARVVWTSQSDAVIVGDAAPPAVLAEDARVVVVVLQALWSHDAITAAESDALRQRMRRRPKSVIVLTVGGATVPEWLDKAARHDLRADGLTPVVEAILSTVLALGGSLTEPVIAADPEAPSRFSSDAPPFLHQARAHSALRRELERLSEGLETRLDAERARDVDQVVELTILPNRFIARHNDAAVSFSWLAGHLGGVNDGRLLVIEWSGVAGTRPGVAALKSAKPVRETTYEVEARDAESWRWRDGEPYGRACSTTDLVGEWLDTAALSSRATVKA